MEKYTTSSDGQKIHYKKTGTGDTAIIFVHGWLGNEEWWEDQKDYFKNKYCVVQMELAGHGKSDTSRQHWTSDQYAEDIKAVVAQINSKNIILVGHSMSGAYVLEAAVKIPDLAAVILVDTIKDLDETFTDEQMEEVLSQYRTDFKNTVENILPQYLFVEKTPSAVKERVQNEFLQNTGEKAVDLLHPLYKTNLRKTAAQINVPVRAINSDASQTNIEANRKYLTDFNYVNMTEVGHYPMMEKPHEFNSLLENIIKQLV